jgi:serine/threonine-protein kinase RsbW
MLVTRKDDASIQFAIFSKIERIQELIEAAKDFAQENTGQAIRLAVVLRELVLNAIQYGNQNVATRQVVCTLRRDGEGGIWLSVQDEGAGFDMRALSTCLPEDPLQAPQRGLAIVKSLCRDIEFNDRGNLVRVHLAGE